MAVFDPDDWRGHVHGHEGPAVFQALAMIGMLAGRYVDILGRIHDEAFGLLLPETEMDPVRGRTPVRRRRRRSGAGAEKRRLTLSVGIAEAHDTTLSANGLFFRRSRPATGAGCRAATGDDRNSRR